MRVELWDVIGLTLQVAGLAVLCALPLAVLVGWVLARKRFVGHGLLNGLVHLPLVLPPVVTGYLLLVLFGRQGALGSLLFETFGISVAFRWTGAALAAGIMAFPLMVRPIRLAIEAVDDGVEEAAGSLGAGGLMRFFTITLPLAAPGILAAAILGLAKAMGEFGATITFVSNIPGETRTLALAIYSLTQVPGAEGEALMLVGIAVALSLLALLLSEVVAQRLAARIRGGI